MSRGTRDSLRGLADDDGLTLDQEIARLVKAERQRRMGLALSAVEPAADDHAWLELGVEAKRDDARG